MSTAELSILTDFPVMDTLTSFEGFTPEQTQSYLKMQQAIHALTPNDLRDERRVNELNVGLAKVASDLGAPAFEELYVVDASISQEGLLSIFGAVIRKVFEWIASIFNWFTGLFRKSKVATVAQNTHVTATANNVKKKADAVKKGDTPVAKADAEKAKKEKADNKASGKTTTSTAPKQTDEQIRSKVRESVKSAPTASAGNMTKSTIEISDNRISFGIPAKAMIIFHSQNHFPETAFVYNADSFRKSFVNIRQNVEWIRGKLYKESGLMEASFVTFAKGVDDNVDMAPLFKLEHAKNNEMFEAMTNNWNAIGYDFVNQETKSSQLRKNHPKLAKMVGSQYGWNTKEGVVVELTYLDLATLADEIANQVKWANNMRNILISMVSDSRLAKGSERLHKELSKSSSENGLTKEQQTTCISMLNDLQIMFNYHQLNVVTLATAIAEYGSLLSQILTGIDTSFVTV